MAEINENIKPWKRSISEAEWNAMWSEPERGRVMPSVEVLTPIAEHLRTMSTEEGELDWMALAIELYVSRYGRRCVTCWNDVANEDVYLVTRDGVHYLFHTACKPQ